MSTPGDYLAERVIDAMALLSIPATAVEARTGRKTKRSWRSARRGLRWARRRTDSAGRVVVIASEEDSPALAAASAPLELAIVEPSPPGGIHMALMSALVANAIVRVSLA